MTAAMPAAPAIPDIDLVRLNFNAEGLLVLNLVLALIMFGVALDLKLADFRRVLDAPRAPLVGLAGQFVLFPALTFALTLWLRPPPSVALGMILVAACPGGNMSNFLTHLAGGNTALSITMSAVSTVAALVLTPLNTAVWGSLNPDTAALLRRVSVSPGEILLTTTLILGLPLALGRLFAVTCPTAAARVRGPIRALSIALFVTFLAVALKLNFAHFLAYVGGVAGIVAIQNGAGLASGWAAGKLMRLPEADVRAIAIETGIQNSGLGLVLIFNFFDGLGGMAIIAAWWGIWHMVTGLSLALVWSRTPAVAPVRAS